MPEPERGPSATAGLHRAVAYALTGSELEHSVARLDQLIDGLDGVTALRAAAAATRESGATWPHRVPERLREGIGAAQLYAAVERARALVEEPPRRVRGTGRPDADDLRLLRDVPPHHG